MTIIEAIREAAIKDGIDPVVIEGIITEALAASRISEI